MVVGAMVSDNVVHNTQQEGIQANGGTTQVQADSMNQSAARNNLLTGMILNNQVQGSGSTSIAVFGGFDNTRGVVSGNTARKNIFGNNIPDTPRCADGIVGNHAECTFNPPSALSAQAQSLGDAQPSDVASMSVPVALAARLSAQATEVDKKVQQLQAMAAMEHDLQLRTRLLELSAQLEALRDKLAARLTGQVAK
jgi:hypothetical protein